MKAQQEVEHAKKVAQKEDTENLEAKKEIDAKLAAAEERRLVGYFVLIIEKLRGKSQQGPRRGGICQVGICTD